MRQIAPLRDIRAGWSAPSRGGYPSAMEQAAEPRYEFTTSRIVAIVVAIVLWVLFSLGSAGRQDDPSTAFGALLGSLLVSLFVSWIVRSLYRLVRRRPVLRPAWTVGLFVGAGVVALLSAAGNAAPPS
jgi:uncharacterized membrane protein